MESEHLYEITAYTENQVGLLSSIAGIFTRRSINIEKLLVYPSKIVGIHKFKIYSWTTAELAKAVAMQIEKKVDVIKVYYHIDERSLLEVSDVTAILEERENNNKQ